MKQECNVIVRWRDFTPETLLLIVSLVCQILLIAGLNIRSIQNKPCFCLKLWYREEQPNGIHDTGTHWFFLLRSNFQKLPSS